MRVLIIGAGLGGLTLLHGLRHIGIDAHVYERSPRHSGQPASYGIHLNADGLRALHNSLPAENWKQIDADGMPAPLIIRFHDPHNGVLATIDKRFPQHATDPITKRRAISRGKLRKALLIGADSDREPTVHWTKTFDHYELTSTRVRAHFTDGTHADGDVLVGADGSNSRVRHQRLPELQRQDLGILNIAGRTPLTTELASLLPSELTDGGINNVVPAGTGWMFLSTWTTGDPDNTDISNGADRYIVWAWAAAKTSYPTGVDDYDGAQLKELATDRIHDWAEPLRAIVDATNPAAVDAVPLRTMPTLPEWAPSPITLLGDAIHNMTPMAGIGANTALRDADQLRRAIAAADNPLHAISRYEIAMRRYANPALRLSTRNATNATLAQPSSRTAFRTLLRIGNHLPMLQKKMFGPTVR
ncbi:FAD-dependent oxidoreductase [Cryptosporangium sp. NPDC048952]|uniref:FAD-dependent oxidoreductase n=1 Tax=Cryptosporangium sp. NPDC048952 TaxID=3363961 RepID=UPI003722339E